MEPIPEHIKQTLLDTLRKLIKEYLPDRNKSKVSRDNIKQLIEVIRFVQDKKCLSLPSFHTTHLNCVASSECQSNQQTYE